MNLATYLTELQKARQLSRSEWATRSGVSRVSLWRWQKGETIPRDIELDAALVPLAPSEAERERAFYLLARERNGQNIQRIAPLAGIPLIRNGLLRALRLRQNLTQQQVADRCAVSPKNLSRWEGGIHWPDPLTLHRLTQFYQATADEIAALTVLPEHNDGELSDSLVDTELGEYDGDFCLLNLRLLSELGRLTKNRTPASVVRETELRLRYAEYLMLDGRYVDVRRELDVVKAGGVLSRECGALAYYHVLKAGLARRSESDVLRKRWLEKTRRATAQVSAMPPNRRLNIRYYTVRLLKDTRQTDTALSLWDDFFADARAQEDDDAMSGAMSLRADLLSESGDHSGALDAVEHMNSGTPLKDLPREFQRGRILAAAGCRADSIKTYVGASRYARTVGLHHYHRDAEEKIALLENGGTAGEG